MHTFRNTEKTGYVGVMHVKLGILKSTSCAAKNEILMHSKKALWMWLLERIVDPSVVILQLVNDNSMANHAAKY